MFEKKNEYKISPKVSFIMGALAGIALVSLVGFIFSMSLLRSGVTIGTTNKISSQVAGAENNANTKPSQPTNTAPTNTAPAEPVDIKVTNDDHIRGDKNAKVTLVEYSDFQCPFCQRHASTMDKVLADYKGKVRLVFRHFPLSFHQYAQKAAEASECVAELGGNDKFWKFHDLVFEKQDQLNFDNLKQWAKDIGLNSSKFNSCLDSGKYASKVQNDLNEGTQFGVEGTPATFVNGEMISGAQPYETFKAKIDSFISGK